MYERYDKLRWYRKLRKENCSEATALEALGISRATFFRLNRCDTSSGLAGLEERSKRSHRLRQPLWDRKTERIVLAIRRRYPLWGKHKLAIQIKRELDIKISASTIGRILKNALANGSIKSVAFRFGLGEYKPRIFKGHAKRLEKGTRAKKPGELVQVDDMEIKLSGILIKHFKAICPTTKIVVEQAYTRATSFVAREFLHLMITQFP